jgi:hypothetical protein
MIRWMTLGMVAMALSAAATAQNELSPLARSIQDDLNRLDSRVTVRDDNRLQSDRLQRSPGERGGAARLIAPPRLRSAPDIGLSSDLGATRQDLRTLKTRNPNAPAIPVLERQLDRIGSEARGSGLYQPSRNPAAIYGSGG